MIRASRFREWGALESRTAGVLVLITAGGAALRLVGIGDQALWVDEAVSLWLAARPAPDALLFLTEARNNPHPPMYFMLLSGWLREGDGLESARLLSAALSTASLPLVYCATILTGGGRAAATLAASLAAVSPFQIWYGQEARMYALLGFLTVASAVSLLMMLRHGANTRRLVIYALSLGMVAYTHTAGLLLVLSHLLILMTRWLLGAREAGIALVGVFAVVVAWLPWLPVLMAKMSHGAVPWIASPTAEDLRMLGLVFAGGLMPHVLWSEPAPALPIASAAAALLLLIALGAVLTRWRSLWPLFVLTVGPLVLQLDAGLLQPILLDRTLIGSGLLLIVLIAVAVFATRPLVVRVLAASAVVAFVAVSVVTLSETYGTPIKERWDLAADAVARQTRPGDVIVLQGNSSELAFRYYYDRPHRNDVPSVATYAVPCSIDSCTRIEEPPTARDRLRLAEAIEGAGRVWLVRRWYGNWDFYLDDAITEQAASGFRLIEERDVGGVVLVLYEAAPR